MMKVIVPVEVTESVLLYTNVTEADAAAWNSGTTYALGDQVMVSHRVYTSAQASNTNHAVTDTAWWTDSGPTNRYKMFDTESNTQTVRALSIHVQLAAAGRIGAIALVGVEADSVRIQAGGAGSPIVYTYDSEAIDVLERATTTWSEYFFGEFRYKTSLVRLDLPLGTNTVIDIEATKTSGNVKIGAVIMGTAYEMADTEINPVSDQIDYSRVNTDSFGTTTITRRKRVKKLTMRGLLTSDEVERLVQIRDDISAVVCFFMGVDDDTDPHFNALSAMGIITRCPIEVASTEHSYVNAEIQGF